MIFRFTVEAVLIITVAYTICRDFSAEQMP